MTEAEQKALDFYNKEINGVDLDGLIHKVEFLYTSHRWWDIESKDTTRLLLRQNMMADLRNWLDRQEKLQTKEV